MSALILVSQLVIAFGIYSKSPAGSIATRAFLGYSFRGARIVMPMTGRTFSR